MIKIEIDVNRSMLEICDMCVTLALDTRCQNSIPNEFNTDSPTAGEIAEAAAYKARFVGATHRPTAVCYKYNCHGLTFAARRTQIIDPAEVRRILTEDAYQRIRLDEILPGDIIIYVGTDGDIEHSGIVVSFNRIDTMKIPVVLSKWGIAHEVVHSYQNCPYNAKNVEFYRLIS